MEVCDFFFEKTDGLAYDVTDLVQVTYIQNAKEPEDTDNTCTKSRARPI